MSYAVTVLIVTEQSHFLTRIKMWIKLSLYFKNRTEELFKIKAEKEKNSNWTKNKFEWKWKFLNGPTTQIN